MDDSRWFPGKSPTDGGSEVDLHGLAPENALRRLAQAIHAARVRGAAELLVITGRGWGNREREPVLRGHVERWLRGEDGKRSGVRGWSLEAQGGALRLRLAGPAGGAE